MLKTKSQIIKGFINYYFNTRRSEYSKNDVIDYKLLIEYGVLHYVKEDKDSLLVVSDSIELQTIVLEIAEIKLKKKLTLNILEAFNFIKEFEAFLKKEYNSERVINSFNVIFEDFKPFILYILSEKGIDVKKFLLSLNDEYKRKNRLSSFERIFFRFLPNSNYSEKEIVEIVEELWSNEDRRHDVISGLRNFPNRNLKKSKRLLSFCYENDVSLDFISDLLIGLYNSGEISIIENIIKLRDKSVIHCLSILGRIKYKSEKDVENAFNQIGDLEFENIEIAIQQSYLIGNIIENEYTKKSIKENAFKLYAEFLKNGNDEIVKRAYQDISFIKNHEAEKYKLFHLYLSKTQDFSKIKSFFSDFSEPAYVFDIMMGLFSLKPNYRFRMNFFENGVHQAWGVNQQKTEEQILDLFKQDPVFGMLGVMVIFSANLGIYQVDFLKLDNAKHQMNVINNVCKHPHSFDELLPLILPLRNSKLKRVREYLQQYLAQKVFSSYHEAVYNEIENSIGKSKKDKEFLKPIKKALDDYNQLKNLKETIDDLNPYQNERDLMNLYYRLEHEQNTKEMNEARNGKGTFWETSKTSIIVRGNSWMIREGEVTPLGKFENSILIDRQSYLNPDLYEHNLNTIE
ncbi:hypothetical protein [Kordia sp.]|uniref:hypothetical protein n=1 Tax=Kordia sp. TaxID=1965332 RepID=UPI003B5979D9